MSPGEIRERIEAISKQEHNELIGFIRQYVYSVYTAEDILQEKYLEALKHAERIQDPTKLMAWLRTVSKRLALKEVTRENKLTKKLSCLFFFSSFSIEDVVIIARPTKS